MPDSIFFHKDDSGQREIIPVGNRDYCLAQFGEIEAFQEGDDSDIADKDIYVPVTVSRVRNCFNAY